MKSSADRRRASTRTPTQSRRPYRRLENSVGPIETVFRDCCCWTQTDHPKARISGNSTATDHACGLQPKSMGVDWQRESLCVLSS